MSNSPSESTPVPQQQETHILIVEDDVAQRFTLAKWLRLQGYTVREAANTDEATLLLASSLMRIDLVITDIWLPGMIHGWDFVEYIRYSFPEMPVIVTSGMYKEGPVDKYTAFFQKPYELDDLSVQISKMLHATKEG